MTDLGRFDVVIMGAGVTGLWAAHDLIEAGARVLLVHAPHPQGYSSTRNQGWLHSGALYAVFRAPLVAGNCIMGSERIHRYAARRNPDVVIDADFSYVFDSPQQADAAVGLCLKMGIAARETETHAEVRELFGRPIFSVSVPDGFVDTSRFLRTMSDDLVARGVHVASVPSLPEVGLRFGGETWNVDEPSFSASGRSVVIAAGSLIPRVLDSVGKANEISAWPAYEATMTTVLAIPGLDLPSAVVSINGGPHIIPFRSARARGVTICVPFDNQPAAVDSIHRAPAPSACERLLANVEAFVPGLTNAIGKAQNRFWYSCQKLVLAQTKQRSDWRPNVFTSVAPHLYVAYAGKFTAAPVLAAHIAQQLDRTWLPDAHPSGRGAVVIADQPFCAGVADYADA
jgi:glycine/D-amino acid oxidase-like deaminating enzyme